MKLFLKRRRTSSALLLIVVLCTFSLPAHAAHRTIVSFEFSDGNTQQIDFDGIGKATRKGVAVDYIFDAEAASVCFEPKSEVKDCIYFDRLAQFEGDTVGFRNSTGGTGTATIVLMEEVDP